MRILLVSNMYPSEARPEYGVFVRDMAVALRERGNEVDEAVLERGRGGLTRYALLGERAVRAARREPDVVYAHFLFPTGLAAKAAARVAGAPYVLTAHGTDVETVQSAGMRTTATRHVMRGAETVIAVSDYLARRLPAGARRVEVIDMGVDTNRFDPAGWEPGEGPRFLFVGSLIERKNAGRLLEAFERLGHGSLTIVGDGPLRAQLEDVAPPECASPGGSIATACWPSFAGRMPSWCRA